MKKIQYLIILLYFCFGKSFGQSPTNLTSNIDLPGTANVYNTSNTYSSYPPSAVFTNATQVVAAFNFARRQEETQKGLPVNSLGNLSLPLTWSSQSTSQKMLYLINSERFSRTGQNYGGGPVLGLPLEGVEVSLQAVAQSHANYVVANNLFTHDETAPPAAIATTSFQRISNTYGAGCLSNIGRSENIYLTCTSSAASVGFIAEQAVFNFMYRDAGSSWGHRDAILIQNISGNLLPPFLTAGYTNDRGSSATEGFLGVGVTDATISGGLCPAGFYAHVLNMNIADPTTATTCGFTLQANPFPVTLLSFNAQADDVRVKLNWKTENETNSSHFEIQRSSDLSEFAKLGTVNAKGNSVVQANYVFEDTEPNLGVLYYRLKQIDFDGTFSYSKIVAVKYNGINENTVDIIIYPNPITVGERIYLKSVGFINPIVKLNDILGRQYDISINGEINNEANLIFNEKLAKGTYFLTFMEQNKKKSVPIVVR